MVYECKFDAKKFKPYYQLESSDDSTLLFESRFEGGNLSNATQIGPFEYNLSIRPDVNTLGHTQWFYFQVKNTIKGTLYKFNIINLMKPNCLYSKGMRPLMYSENMADQKSIGWHRVGTNISYTMNPIEENIDFDNPPKRPLNTLSFTIAFDGILSCHSF